MKDTNIKIKLIKLITLILLYHITKPENIFLYVLTLSLYNIFTSCFDHITIKNSLKKETNKNNQIKILKYTVINIVIISIFFILLSILISDAVNIFLNIRNSFLPYLFMSTTIIIEPTLKILLEYLETCNKTAISNTLSKIYIALESTLLLILAILFFKFFKIPIYMSVSLLYLSKIISFIIIIYFIIKIIKKENNQKNEIPEKKYKKEIKEILTNNSHKSMINLIKNSYYYISIIVVYIVLKTKYSYDLSLIEKDITFIYLYGISIINFIVDLIILITNQKDNIIKKIYLSFEKILRISIVIGITSPLICKIIFLTTDNSLYIKMLCIMSIFLLLYNITFEYLKNIKLVYISLISGIIFKVLLIIPLINSFYRMGYNLIYGDVISTIIAMSISIIINYIYIKLNTSKEKTIEKILSIIYDSMLLCIILIIIQFIVPIKSYDYFRTLVTLIIYISISIAYIKFKKRKERKK